MSVKNMVKNSISVFIYYGMATDNSNSVHMPSITEAPK